MAALHRFLKERVRVAEVIREALLAVGFRFEDLRVGDRWDVDRRHLADDPVGQLPDHLAVGEFRRVDVVGLVLLERPTPVDLNRADRVAVEDAVVDEGREFGVRHAPPLDPRTGFDRPPADFLTLVEDLVAFEGHPVVGPDGVHDAAAGLSRLGKRAELVGERPDGVLAGEVVLQVGLVRHHDDAGRFEFVLVAVFRDRVEANALAELVAAGLRYGRHGLLAVLFVIVIITAVGGVSVGVLRLVELLRPTGREDAALLAACCIFGTVAHGRTVVSSRSGLACAGSRGAPALTVIGVAGGVNYAACVCCCMIIETEAERRMASKVVRKTSEPITALTQEPPNGLDDIKPYGIDDPAVAFAKSIENPIDELTSWYVGGGLSLDEFEELVGRVLDARV